MTIVTISRQYGSGGDDIAVRVCELLGYNLFDKRLLVQAAVQAGLAAQDVVDFSVDRYKSHSIFDHLITGWRAPHTIARSRIWQEELMPPEASSKLDQAQSVALVESTIHAAAEQGNIVILGRGGQAYLKDVPDVLHARVEAPLENRSVRIQAREGIDLTAARDKARRRDRASAGYLHQYYQVDWADPLHYHLVLNTGKLSVEAAAQLVARAVECMSL